MPTLVIAEAVILLLYLFIYSFYLLMILVVSFPLECKNFEKIYKFKAITGIP